MAQRKIQHPTAEEIDRVLQMIRLLGAEFVGVSDAVIRQYIDLFSAFCGAKPLGDLYCQGLALFICHKLKMAGLGDNKYGNVDEAMRIASVSEGNVSVSYNASQTPTASANAEFLLTSYGVQYLEVLHRKIIAIHCGGMS